jgi:hypothetical protein
MKPTLKFLSALLLTLPCSLHAADDSPLRDLSRKEILPALRSGAVEKVDGVVVREILA